MEPEACDHVQTARIVLPHRRTAHQQFNHLSLGNVVCLGLVMTRRRKNRNTITDWEAEAQKVGKDVLSEFGRLGKDIAIEGLVLGMDVTAGVATLGLSAPRSNSGGRSGRRRRR